MHTFSAFLRGSGKVLLDNTYGLGALPNKGFLKHKNRKTHKIRMHMQFKSCKTSKYKKVIKHDFECYTRRT